MLVSFHVSLQVLISAVSDLLTELLKAEEISVYILKDYIEWLTPSKCEWEKMQESLSTEVELTFTVQYGLMLPKKICAVI